VEVRAGASSFSPLSEPSAYHVLRRSCNALLPFYKKVRCSPFSLCRASLTLSLSLARPVQAEHFFSPGKNTQNQPPDFTSSLRGLSFPSSPTRVPSTDIPPIAGSTGPISVSYPPYLGAQFNAFYTSLKSLGIPVATDLHSGNNHGVSLAPSTMHNNGTDRTRSYSVDYRAFCFSFSSQAADEDGQD
jgi:hypothetical protein